MSYRENLLVGRNATIKAKLLLILTGLLMLSIPTSAQNDNCCGIDRQCSTNDDWVRGYYAFRNSQCAAPDFAMARSAKNEPSQSNNCCFNGWQCDSDDDWTSGYWAFRRDLCDAQSQAQGDNGNRQRQGVNGIQGLQGPSDDPGPQRLYSNRKRADEPLTVRVVNGVLVDDHGNPLRWESISFNPNNLENREDETESGVHVILQPLSRETFCEVAWYIPKCW